MTANLDKFYLRIYNRAKIGSTCTTDWLQVINKWGKKAFQKLNAVSKITLCKLHKKMSSVQYIFLSQVN